MINEKNIPYKAVFFAFDMTIADNSVAHGLYYTEAIKFTPQFKLYDGIIEAIETLNSKGLITSIVTCNVQGNIREAIKILNLPKSLHISGHRFGMKKEPHICKTKVIKHALREEGIFPWETLYVGADENDALVCKELGVPCVIANWNGLNQVSGDVPKVNSIAELMSLIDKGCPDRSNEEPTPESFGVSEVLEDSYYADGQRELIVFEDDFEFPVRTYPKMRTKPEARCILYNSYAQNEAQVLSNMYKCPLVINGHTFNSMEQFYLIMHFPKFPELQRELLVYKDPKKVHSKWKELKKTLTKKFKNGELKEDPMAFFTSGYSKNIGMFAMRVKYKQCKEYREFLQTHPTEPLVEYTYWKLEEDISRGGGSDVDMTYKENWKIGALIGHNGGGVKTMIVREEGRLGLLDGPIPFPYEEFKLFGETIKSVE